MSENGLELNQLSNHLWESANILRGPVDAADFKTFIFPLLFFKRISDVYDEEIAEALAESDGDQQYARFPENHRFQIPEDCHWGDVRKKTSNVGKALQRAMREIEKANPDSLYGIFGDAQWTNKERLPDHTLKEMIEHFSKLTLSIANCPEDELGVGYEYLIKKFADDSGHTAAEFYTNRTVVHMMTELLTPQSGESIYDPTCGSGGMLLSCVTHLRSQKKEWRTLKLFGQERNLMTSAMARMNCFLHGIEDFQVVRGDTLADPKFVDLGERLEKIKDRHEQGLIDSKEFLKQLLELAKDVVEAEQHVDPEEEQGKAKAALTELFMEVKTKDTPVIVERIVNDIDEIVRMVRFPGWQGTSAGEREVQKALRKTLLKYHLHKDQELFDRAYGYIRQYY